MELVLGRMQAAFLNGVPSLSSIPKDSKLENPRGPKKRQTRHGLSGLAICVTAYQIRLNPWRSIPCDINVGFAFVD